MIYKDAPFQIMDDSLSAVDTSTERRILRNLLDLVRLFPGSVERALKATIIISHRLSAVQHADEIVVFDDGRIVERGSHTELLAIGGHYAGLWYMQAGIAQENDSDRQRDVSQPDLDVEMDVLEAGRLEEVL